MIVAVLDLGPNINISGDDLTLAMLRAVHELGALAAVTAVNAFGDCTAEEIATAREACAGIYNRMALTGDLIADSQIQAIRAAATTVNLNTAIAGTTVSHAEHELVATCTRALSWRGIDPDLERDTARSQCAEYINLYRRVQVEIGLARLTPEEEEQLHRNEGHPEWEYTTTRGVRKGTTVPPDGDGWEKNERVWNGSQFIYWDRDELCDYEHWRRRRRDQDVRLVGP